MQQALHVDDSDHEADGLSVTVGVRPATREDAAVLADLAAEAFRATYGDLLEPATTEAVISQTCTTAAFLELAAREEPDRLLVAVDDDAVQGFLDFAQEPDGLELRRLYARVGKTGGGVGAALLAALEQQLPSNTTYRIVVVAENSRGLAFWQRHGFRPDGEVDGIEHFAEHRGVHFRPGSGRARLLVLRRTTPAGA